MIPFMTTTEIRQTFLNYFAQRGHTIVPGSSLVPVNDATLLFSNAGMVPFKDTFLGLEVRPYQRATTVQKCMRVSGKHNDLDNVGLSPRHHTFFEMLGNFSFGDYFKRDAIGYAWQLLTQQFQLPAERLWITVYHDDDQAAQLWAEVGVDPQRILRFGAKENFWSMGDTGPCGPSSEIHYYQGTDISAQRAEGVNSDDDNYVEIWNLVFMQYNRDSQGQLTPLAQPSIDTGMGLERLAAVLQGVTNNYETDGFVPIIRRIGELLGVDTIHYQSHRAAYHAIADHSRAIAFLLADGVRPGNEGRDYVVRRILRRAAYFGQTLGFERSFLAEIVHVAIDILGSRYPELFAKCDYIKQTVTAEEERFHHTLTTGLHHLEEVLIQTSRQGSTEFPGKAAFILHDTYGFPLDLTQKVLTERGILVNIAEYEDARREQQERSRSVTRFKQSEEQAQWSTRSLQPTEFVGYQTLQAIGRILALEVANRQVSSVVAGQQAKLVVDRTPFYAESGGQVADTGNISGPNGQFSVEDVQKPVPGIIVHQGMLTRGSLALGEQVEQVVDGPRRYNILRNHTATHLLHRALREVLGNHVEQAGSLVAPDHLRFDFSHPSQITPEQLQELERRVNVWIRADYSVDITLMKYADARETGAMALFGEKYGDIVRVVTIGGDQQMTALDPIAHDSYPLYSRELCGGTHAVRTGQLGHFHITSEGSISAGLRRIEAVTGQAADTWLEQQSQLLYELAEKLTTPLPQLSERIEALLAELKKRNIELSVLQAKLAESSLPALLAQVQHVGTLSYIAAQVDVPGLDVLRHLLAQTSKALQSGVVVLGAILEGKPQLVISVSPDLVQQDYHAGNLARELAKAIGGGGGGRADMAQAGGRDLSGLTSALSAVPILLRVLV